MLVCACGIYPEMCVCVHSVQVDIGVLFYLAPHVLREGPLCGAQLFSEPGWPASSWDVSASHRCGCRCMQFFNGCWGILIISLLSTHLIRRLPNSTSASCCLILIHFPQYSQDHSFLKWRSVKNLKELLSLPATSWSTFLPPSSPACSEGIIQGKTLFYYV